MKQKKTRNKKLVLNIIVISVAACTTIALLLTIFASRELSATYEQLVEETLKTAAIQMADEIERMYEGEWNLDEDDVLWKGETAFRGQFTGALKQRTGLDYAIFYDNIRAITTVEGSPVGRKNADTTAPTDIYNTVVRGGQTYYRPNYMVAGQQYSGVYAPVLADDGSIGGMTVAFRKTADVNAAIRKIIVTMIILALVCVCVVIAIGVVLYRSSAAAMKNIVESLVQMASGDLRVEFSQAALDRTDELGTIAESSQTLVEELTTVISSAKSLSGDVSQAGQELSESAGQASEASGQVTSAIDDISKGAVGQADSVQTSANNTADIGNDIKLASTGFVREIRCILVLLCDEFHRFPLGTEGYGCAGSADGAERKYSREYEEYRRADPFYERGSEEYFGGFQPDYEYFLADQSAGVKRFDRGGKSGRSGTRLCGCCG